MEQSIQLTPIPSDRLWKKKSRFHSVEIFTKIHSKYSLRSIQNIHKNSMITNRKLSDSVTCIELRHFIVLYLLKSTLSLKQKHTIKSDIKICLKSQFISGRNRYGFRYIVTSKSDIHAHTFCRQFLCIIKERTNKKMNGKNNAGIHHDNHCHHETLRKCLDTTFAFDRLQNIGWVTKADATQCNVLFYSMHASIRSYTGRNKVNRHEKIHTHK